MDQFIEFVTPTHTHRLWSHLFSRYFDGQIGSVKDLCSVSLSPLLSHTHPCTHPCIICVRIFIIGIGVSQPISPTILTNLLTIILTLTLTFTLTVTLAKSQLNPYLNRTEKIKGY